MTNSESTVGSAVRRDFRSDPSDGRRRLLRDRARPSGLTSLNSRERIALGALIGLVLTGVGIAVASAGTGDSFGIPRQGRHAQSWVVGLLSPFGGYLSAPRFFVAFAVMWGFYLIVVGLADAVRPRWAITAIAALTLTFTIAPVLFSRDVFSYIDYARLGVIHHMNPYAHAPDSAPHDPVYPWVGWRTTVSVYGPLFTILSFPLALLGVTGALWAFKAITGAAALGCVALIWRCAKRVGESPVFAALLLGLNPVFLVLAVSGAHNDVLALFILVAAVTLALTRREALAGASLVASVAVKATAGVVLPFMALGARRRRSAIEGILIGGVVIGLVALAVFGTAAKDPFTLAAGHRNYYFEQSVPQHVAVLLNVDPRSHILRRLFELIGLAAIAILLLRTMRRRDWLSGAGWATFAVLVTTTYMQPWYTIWVLPFAAVARDRRLVYATLALGTFVVASRFYFLQL
jgi:alpha-1,6-mannosyltransferase